MEGVEVVSISCVWDTPGRDLSSLNLAFQHEICEESQQKCSLPWLQTQDEFVWRSSKLTSNVVYLASGDYLFSMYVCVCVCVCDTLVCG